MKKIVLLTLIAFCITNVKAQNTAYGIGALANVTSGTYNSAFGTNALLNNTLGNNNVAVGEFTLLSNTIGSLNIGIGPHALNNNTWGSGNLAIGNSALVGNISGNQNIAIGSYAMQQNTSGYTNLAHGVQSLFNNTTGNYNLAIGLNSGYGLQTGSYNTIIGHDFSGGLGLVTGSSNTIIGSRVSGLASNLSNTIILADGSGNQRFYIDNNGNAGLGTTIPNARLEINSNIPDASGLRFSQLTSSSATVATNGKALTVDASGNVVLTTAGGTGGSFFTNATVGTNNIINTNTGGVIIGEGINIAPSGYKLYVSDGILTEKVKVAVKNSGQWADYVFDPNYPLLDIASLNHYVVKNKHLPGIQSANEIKENGGFELGATTIKLLEKIEELTLYVIQLKKEIDEIRLNKVSKK